MQRPEDDPLETRPTLIDRIRNLENEDAWFEFVELYRPMIVRFCLSRGITAHDAEDIAQKALAWVIERIQDYEYRPETCSFRTWLLKKVRFLILDRLKERKRNAVDEDMASALGQVPDPKGLAWEEEWEREHQRALLDAASQIVRRRVTPKNFQAYELYRVQGLPLERVTQKLDVTPDYVYVASHRVTAKLKAAVRRLQEF